MQKWNFRFGPNGNWIMTLPHICLFYPPKMGYHGKKLHHMYHACRITVKFNGFFFFAKIFAKFSWDFCENFRENKNFPETQFREKSILLKWDVMAKNYTTCTMHVVSLWNLMEFSFSRKFSRNFREIFAKLSWQSSHFRMIFAFAQKLKNAFSFQP
jgi:hypothetical protein